MPQFNTGTSWDQGLNSLSSMLFPDPSKIAQAGYYGAQQRNARIQGDTILDQQQHLHGMAGIPVGPDGQHAGPAVVQPPVYYNQPGPRLPGVEIPKGPWPEQTGMGQGVATGMPGQGQAAPQLSLAQTLTPGQVQTSPLPPLQGAPVSQGYNQGYQAGSAPKLGQVLTQSGVVDKFTHGEPPPMASPTASAPPAPTTTGSDGSVPANDPLSGAFHPGSITAPDGGPKMSGPASPDGSPAPPMDLARLFVMAKLSGMSDGEATNYVAGSIIDMQQHGQIDKNTATQALASVGRTGQLQSETTIAQQALQTGATVQEQARQHDIAPMTILDDSDTVRAIPRKQWAENPESYRYIDPASSGAFAAANVGTINVHPNLPDGRPDMTRSIIVPKRQAVQQRLQPTKPDWSPIGTDSSGAEDAAFGREGLIKGVVEREYAAEPRKPGGDSSREEPGELSEAALAAVRDRANVYMRTNPKFSGDQKNYGAAAGQALRDLQKEGYLETRQSAQARRTRTYWDAQKAKLPFSGSDQDVMQGTDVSGNPRPAFRIDLLKTYKPAAPNAQLNAPDGNGALAQTLKNGMTQGPGKIAAGRAAPGMVQPNAKEGDVVADAQGNPMKIQNGVAVALSPEEAQRYAAWLRSQQSSAAVAGQQ